MRASLFRGFWWLLVIGSVGFAILGMGALWADYHLLQEQIETDPPSDPSWHVRVGAVVLLVSLLPFAIMTLIRWNITRSWRFGPRW